MATHSNILAWRIPGTEEPGGLWSMASQRVGHDGSDLAHSTVRVLGIRKVNIGMNQQISKQMQLRTQTNFKVTICWTHNKWKTKWFQDRMVMSVRTKWYRMLSYSEYNVCATQTHIYIFQRKQITRTQKQARRLVRKHIFKYKLQQSTKAERQTAWDSILASLPASFVTLAKFLHSELLQMSCRDYSNGVYLK